MYRLIDRNEFICFFRSVVSIGNNAISRCASLKEVLILSKAVAIGDKAFCFDTALIRVDATTEICSQVLSSCGGTCFIYKTCSNATTLSLPTSSSTGLSLSAPGGSGRLPAGVIVGIVNFAIVGVGTIVALTFWFLRWRRRTQYVGYDAVQSIEMNPLPPRKPTEARVVPHDQTAVPYPVASVVVSVLPTGSEEATAAVYCHDVGFEHLHLIVNDGNGV
jgi:hypothetical protein